MVTIITFLALSRVVTEIVSAALDLDYIHEQYIYPSSKQYFSTSVKFVHLPSPFNCVAEYWKLPHGFAERFTIIRCAAGQHSVAEKLTPILSVVSKASVCIIRRCSQIPLQIQWLWERCGLCQNSLFSQLPGGTPINHTTLWKTASNAEHPFLLS